MYYIFYIPLLYLLDYHILSIQHPYILFKKSMKFSLCLLAGAALMGLTQDGVSAGQDSNIKYIS